MSLSQLQFEDLDGLQTQDSEVSSQMTTGDPLPSSSSLPKQSPFTAVPVALPRMEWGDTMTADLAFDDNFDEDGIDVLIFFFFFFIGFDGCFDGFGFDVFPS